MQQRINMTRKLAVEQQRPPSRHNPPNMNLFLEVPKSDAGIPQGISQSTPEGTPPGHAPEQKKDRFPLPFSLAI